MGWESGISMGANAVNSFVQTQNAVAQTKGIAESAENTAQNLANKTSRTEGTLETSFLKGGIALTGSGGPAAVFQQAAAQGTTDIQRTIDNANSSISNTMNSARTAALNGIAQGFSKLGSGTLSTQVDQMYQGSWLQSAWNGMTGNLDPSPQGGGTASIGGGTGGFGSNVDWSLPK